jgi:predicted nucleotidyltransferase
MDALPLLPDRRHLITDIVTGLRTIRGVTAIVLGSSYAMGTAGTHSDIDLGVYYADVEPFSIEEMRHVAHSVAGRDGGFTSGGRESTVTSG